MDLPSVLFHGESLFSPGKRDVKHELGVDRTSEHVWFLEPTTSGVLTKDGVENIANHKYMPGTYTHLDTFCNPIWTSLTELLPLWLAPNMVTTLGGLHCAFGFAVTWYYSAGLDSHVPSWVVFLNGYCAFVYYTLDCMDGKQARRTGSSSPLGQLFDHGFDCISQLFHLSSLCTYFMIGGTYWYVIVQSSLQFSFLMAQWEEYYTHVLPHATGDWCGVTEVNYGLALFSMLNAFMDRKEVWTSPLSESLPSPLNSIIPDSLASMEVRFVALLCWYFMLAVLVVLSTRRVVSHVKDPKLAASAISKLVSPFLLATVPFILPPDVVQDSARYLSISMGFAFSIITIKVIVFSMAKMAMATFQLEILPFVVVCIWARVDDRLTGLGAKTLFQICSVWYGYRLLLWASTAIDQICKRLDIYCFTIKAKPKKE